MIIPITSRILIVDDTPTNIQLVGQILKKEPYELSFSLGGKDAINQAQHSEFDLVLLDIMMPEMDGFEVCEALKSDPKTSEVPIIFLTAKTDPESIVKGFQVGGADYVTKPFKAEELKVRIQNHLKLKQNQDELRVKNQELNLAVEIKNQLLGITAHDLKNPLGVIQGYARLLMDSEDIPEGSEEHDISRMILKSSQKSLLLIHDLLDTAALEMGKMELNILCFPMNDLLEHTLEHFQVIARDKQQTLSLKYETAGIIHADLSRIKQVIENLLSNALKYSPPHSEVTIELTEGQKHIYFTIQDQGPGFTPEDQTKMYQYFQRLSAQPTGKESSSGMGLAIIKQIIELHQGQIELETHPGKGSKFKIRLPKKQSV